MDAFPGARIDTVHDTAADAYGLPTEPIPDAEPFEETELDEWKLSGLMKQAQQMQEKMQEMQSKLEALEIEESPARAWLR